MVSLGGEEENAHGSELDYNLGSGGVPAPAKPSRKKTASAT
jgi:hypothetical protein